MKPRIGLSMNYGPGPNNSPYAYLDQPYYDYVRRYGAQPVPLVPSRLRDELAEQLDQVDALILTGGADPDPALWGEERHPEVSLLDPLRQLAEFLLYELALERQRPVLAICLGMQVVNVYHGGALHQHLPDLGLAVTHRRSPGRAEHKIEIVADSILHQWVGPREAIVNSYHHQGVSRVGAGLKVIARSEDGLVEALTRPESTCVVAVQWHPERDADSPVSRALLEGFISMINQQ